MLNNPTFFDRVDTEMTHLFPRVCARCLSLPWLNIIPFCLQFLPLSPPQPPLPLPLPLPLPRCSFVAVEHSFMEMIPPSITPTSSRFDGDGHHLRHSKYTACMLCGELLPNHCWRAPLIGGHDRQLFDKLLW